MHASAFDRFRAGKSPVHLLDPRVKVVATLAFVLACLLVPDGSWAGLGLALLFVVAVTVAAGLEPTYALSRSLVALPFALVALSTLFVTPGAPLLALEVGPISLAATDAGLVRFASIVARSLLAVQLAIVLTATTQFPDLIHALRHLGLPRALVSTMTFMYRYLFVLGDEALRLTRARDSRRAAAAGAASGRSLWWHARVAGHMAGQLFLRGYERGDRVYQAMLSRGFSGHLLTLRPHAMQRRDWVSASLVGIYLAIMVVVGRLAR